MQVMLRVTDLDKSIKYYTEALGMKLLRKKDNEKYKYTLAFLGYEDEDKSTIFELTYNWCVVMPLCVCKPKCLIMPRKSTCCIFKCIIVAKT